LTSTAATILVCEDDPSLRLLFRLTLEPQGYNVVEAGDGRSGIELARSIQPDLFVVDMALPDCSGIEVVRAIKEEPALEKRPVLMSTGSMQPGDRLTAEDAGVDAFLYKPFNMIRLVTEIQRLLEKRETSDPGLSLRRLH
jgi:two-component system alkaline phosphatase synthesis response regulator PhoP